MEIQRADHCFGDSYRAVELMTTLTLSNSARRVEEYYSTVSPSAIEMMTCVLLQFDTMRHLLV